MNRIIYLIIIIFSLFISLSADAALTVDGALEITAVELQECDSLDNFYVDIEFETNAGASPGFIIRGNGVIYDTFTYGQPFYTVGPLLGDCSTIYEFVVADLLDPSCSDFWVLDEPVCCNPCRIDVDDLVQLDCDSTGFVELRFNLITENEGQDGFDLVFNGLVIEHFDFGQAFYSIQVPGDGDHYILTVRDTEFPDCEDIFDFEVSECPEVPDCPFDLFQLGEITVGDCTSDSTYNVTLNDVIYNGNDSLIILLRGSTPFTIHPDDLPFTFTDLSTDQHLYEIFYFEQNNPFCFNGNEWESPDCSDFDQCKITDVQAELHACNDSTNLVLVDITFNVVNPVSDSFEIRGNGISYGIFAYGDPFYTVGPIEANCDANYEFIVIDLDNPDCRGAFGFDIPPCCEPEECELWDLVVDPGNCTGDGVYSLFVDFEFSGVAGDEFDVFSGGNYVGTYLYADLPIEIDQFPERDAPQDLITICDNDNPDCCISLEFDAPNCQEECGIFDVNVDPVACVGDGFYSLFLNFEYENVSSDSFEVFSQGQQYGTFAFADLPVFIPEFPERDVAFDIITICEQDNDDCCTTHEFTGLDCMEEEEECLLYDVVIDPDECTGDGLYALWLNFEYENVDNDFFEVFSQGQFIGFYAFADLPVYIDEFPERDAAFDIITICVNDNPDCCITHEFIGLDCMEEGECDITSVFAEAYECNEDGEIYFDLDFEIENPGDQGFTVVGNGINYGNFEYGEPFYTLGPVPGDCSTVYELIVIDNENIDCEGVFEFDAPFCCEEELCLISGIEIDPLECTGDGLYSLVLNFEYENVTNDFFDVFSNGEYVGTYAYADLPVTVEDFPERDAEFDLITVCDNDNPDCCTSFEFIGLDCGEGACAIYDIVVEPIECTGDGEYSIVLDFEFQDNTNDFFNVFSDGNLVGFYAYADLPITIENFPGREAEFDIIQICDNDNPSCCAVHEFIGLDCEENDVCGIFDISVDPLECTGDGQYALVLNFEYENVTGDFFDVFSNGEFVGFYAYADLPVTIDNFPERDAEFDIIQICDNDNPSCCGILEFEGLDCEDEEGECNIFEINVDPLECTGDGTYSLVLNFEYENVTNDFFEVFSNGDFVGFYAFEDLPVTIDSFPERDAEYDIITICENDNPDCCQSHEFIGLDCSESEECIITGLFAEASECTEDGTFFIDFEFEYDNTGSMGFEVRGNGTVYDTFAYGEPFYTVGPIEANCDIIYELVVIDLEFPDCSDDFTFDDEICCDDEEEDCNISDLQAEVYECDTIGDIVFVDIWFEVSNPDAAGFTVAGNGVVYDTFEYGETFYTVGPILADCSTIYEFVVTDLENPDCSDAIDLDGPICCEEEPACAIDSIIILEADCIDDVFIIAFDVEASNTGEIGFDLYIDSVFHSFQLYENLPVVIEVNKNEFPDPFLMTVCDNDSESCCLSVIFDFDMIDAIDRIDQDDIDILIQSNNINVSLTTHDDYSIDIFSLDGKRILSQRFDQQIDVATDRLLSGIYILHVTSAEGIFSQKFAIIR